MYVHPDELLPGEATTDYDASACSFLNTCRW